ncbi:SigB/SigF/SigG family RNA polymerase sigma factor [Aquipuribacter nitratireducens]|uniref:SigB/SigF/SigG family RNA polymerase sigma factor n=1 Tax=Aquipuribacter nitratireducens TaxID=650104 RepID=A0ABW0GS05_9MICO
MTAATQDRTHDRARERSEERAAARAEVEARTHELFERIARCECEEQRRLLQEEVVLLNLPSARALAMRYRDRGVPVDDLVQVASLGLVKAAQGYDAERGTDFMAYAAPTVTGEVKRYFRDTGWAVRPPRRVQELRAQVATATQRLAADLGRSATVAEVAAELGVGQEDVVEALVSGNGYTTASLDAPPGDDPGTTWADTVSDGEPEQSRVADRVALERLLARLPARDRHILSLRFFAERTQSEIGEQIGVTQMQVSRLLSRALARLRAEMEHENQETGAG